MDDWYTVKQAAIDLEISMQRVYALLAAGTLSGKKVGNVRMVNRRSVQLYRESPSRNKFAGGHLRPASDGRQPALALDGDDVAYIDGEEWRGLRPPRLSEAAQRLHDERSGQAGDSI